MRILALSDAPYPALYSSFERARWAGVRLVLGCGDLPAEYLDFVATSLGAPLLYVRGNHDQQMQDTSAFVGENIDRRLVVCGGLRILGFEGCAWYGGKGVEFTQREMAWRVWRTYLALWRAGGVDIVVSHAPPELSAEVAPAAELSESILSPARADDYRYVTAEPGPSDPAHRGFDAFTALIKRFRPRLWLHGHTHLNYSRAARVRRLGDTFVANAYEYVLSDLEPRVPPASQGR
ncbi:MAG: metallophosphoesterase [Chloroflexi bacterium]|nr:metallophosphoesterase [Chloroflexota bacterium]